VLSVDLVNVLVIEMMSDSVGMLVKTSIDLI
jgi:hypothetical protein